MTGGLKVYYVSRRSFLIQNTLPTFYGTLPIIRTILSGKGYHWLDVKMHDMGIFLLIILSVPMKIRFVAGGDGPKSVRLEEMREKHSLHDRVEMLRAVPHACVQSLLISGHIFLNSSLTEAFCIAILEAATCGLLTVSTRVAGVPEVLPDDMIVLAEPDPSDMVRAIMKAVSILPRIDPQYMHDRMKKLYNWHDVAKRTEIVYDRTLKCSNQNLIEHLSRYLSCGACAGRLFCLVTMIDFLLWRLLQLLQPAEDIEEVPDFILPHQHQESEI